MNIPQPEKKLLLTAWLILLAISLLPKVLLQEVFHQEVSQTLQLIISAGVILISLLATLVWKTLRGLRPFLILFLVWVGIQWVVYTQLDQLPFYQRWLKNPSFNVYMLAEQSLHLIVTLVIIVTLLAIKKKRQDFYLARGDMSAPAQPIRWLGVKAGDRWSRLGGILAVCISLGTLAFLFGAGRPTLDVLVRSLPFLPAVLLAAALNAFNEEVTYKGAVLSVLESPLGKRQALYMVAVYFGIAHFYGIPYGIVGVLLATFLGWILAKSMQETRGLFWAWFIHFVQDVLIFAFLAIGSVTPGGL